MNKTNNIYFPLCCLNYGKNIKQTAELLISYGIVEYAEKLKGWELTDNDFEKIEQYINEQTLNDADEEEDYFIILSAISLNINIYNLSHTKENHAEIERHIGEFEREHGADAKIKIHKGILFDLRDGKFDERMFRVYCAVLSIIGDKKFIRITNKRISYRMLGFKSQEVFYKEKPNYKLMTARQIKTTSDKLTEKNLFAKLTYKNRMTFYSTAYRGEAFRKVLTNSIALNKEKKEVNRILNEKLNADVDNQRKGIREKLISGLSVKEIKCEMELVKVG